MQNLQEKLHLINRLSNCMQKVTALEAKEIAYLIHRIVEEDITQDIIREVTKWNIYSNKELFISV